jgi:hypothetical protein
MHFSRPVNIYLRGTPRPLNAALSSGPRCDRNSPAPRHTWRLAVQYRFSGGDYIVLVLSYVFFGLFVLHPSAAELVPALACVPPWALLAAALILNLWCVPLPGVHPRLPRGADTGAAASLPGPAGSLPKGSSCQGLPPRPRKRPHLRPGRPSPGERLGKGLAKTHKGFIGRIQAVFGSPPPLTGL